MRILFLNQYFPPDPAPTGILFREIADDLERNGHTVDFVDAGIDYRGTQKKGGRMKRELASLWRMLRAASHFMRRRLNCSRSPAQRLLFLAPGFAGLDDCVAMVAISFDCSADL